MENQKKQQNNLSIFYHGPFRDAGGYAKMNREISKALIEKGVNVNIQVMSSNRSCKEVSIDNIQNNASKFGKNESFYLNASLPQYPPNREYIKNIVFTMMETETVHKDFVDKCNLYDEIFVPCEWNVRTFKESGVRRPIKKVRLGVDVELYNPLATPYIFTENKKFVFFSLFGWSKRKGCDILLRSFIRQFGNNPDVILVVASRLWGSEERGKNRMILEEMNSYAKAEGYKQLPPNIIHIGTGFEEKDMPSLFTGADCFVLPTRGDSWGLPLIEAGACEIPIITTKYGGQLEYLDESTANFIDIEGFEECKNLKLDTISSYYAKHIKIAKLSNNAIDQLAEKMTYIINNYTEAKEKSKKLREHIINNFTWQHSADDLIKNLSGE